MIIVDTGPLYAAADTSDSRHRACVAVFEETSEQLVVPVSVVIETSWPRMMDNRPVRSH